MQLVIFPIILGRIYGYSDSEINYWKQFVSDNAYLIMALVHKDINDVYI